MKKQKNLWTVDLGEAYTKITRGFQDETGVIQIENYWIEKTPQDIFSQGVPEKKIDLVVFLRDLLKGHQKRDELILVLNHRKMVLAPFTFPIMTMDEVKDAIQWKMQMILPEKWEEWRIDFLVKERIERFEYLGVDDKKLDVLGIGVEKELLSAHYGVFKRTRHVLKTIEPQFYSFSKIFDEKTTAIIIDMGKTGTRLFFYSEGFLQDERRIEKKESDDLESSLMSVIKEIQENFQSPLGLSRGYENGDIYLLGGESLKDGVLNYMEKQIHKQIKPFTIILEQQSIFRFKKEMTKEELCLLMPCLCGMLKWSENNKVGIRG